MSQGKLCKSCSGPLSDYKNEQLKHPDFCPYCVDDEGKLKSYGDILASMIDYIKHDHKEIPQDKQLDTAEEWLKEGPVWKEKFVTKEVVIEGVREQNIKDIPIMNKQKHYDCNRCMYYMMQSGKKSVKTKSEWFKQIMKKYGISGGKILYFKGESVGFTQFAPKKEFIKLEELSKNSTKTDSWYLSCLAIKKEYRGKGFAKLLLKSVLSTLKKKGVKKLQACGQVSGDSDNYSSGYWKLYSEFGFKKIGGNKDFTVGEKLLE